MFVFYSLRKILAISSSILYLSLVCCGHLCLQSLPGESTFLPFSASRASIECKENRGQQELRNNYTELKCDCCFEQVQVVKQVVKTTPVQDINILPKLYSQGIQGIIEQFIQVEYDYAPTVYFSFFNTPPPLLNGSEKRISIQSFLL